MVQLGCSPRAAIVLYSVIVAPRDLAIGVVLREFGGLEPGGDLPEESGWVRDYPYVKFVTLAKTKR